MESTVVLHDIEFDEDIEYVIVGSSEADSLNNKISNESPLGAAMLGKKVGDTVEFGGLLGYAPVMPVNSFDCSAFINRGGRIPAPIHSFKN